MEGRRLFLRLYSLPPTMIMRIWALCCTISGWRNLLCCIPAALHFWRSANLNLALVFRRWRRLDATPVHDWPSRHDRMSFRHSHANGIRRGKKSFPERSVTTEPQFFKWHFARPFYSACNAYHQILKKKENLSAVPDFSMHMQAA